MIQVRPGVLGSGSLRSVDYLKPFLTADAPLIGLLVVVGAFAAIAEMASVAIVLLLIAVLLGGSNVLQAEIAAPLEALVQTMNGQLGVAAALLFAFVLVRLALKIGHGVLTARMAARIGHELRQRSFAAILAMSLEELGRRSWGDLHALTWEYAAAVPAGVRAFCDLLRAATVVGILAAVLLAIAPLLSLIAIASFLLLSKLAQLLRKPVIAAGERSSEADRRMSEYLIRTLSALRTYRTLGLSRSQAEGYAAASRKAAEAEERVDTLGALIDPASHIAVLLSLMVMAFTAEFLDLPVAQLLLAVGLLYRLQPYAASLQEQRLELNRLNGPLARGEQMPTRDERDDYPPIPDGAPLGDINFEHVSFRYQSRSSPVVSNLSFSIPFGGWTLIEGPSGSGKSTLVNLLLGFLVPSSGRITCGDIDLSHHSPESWRRHLAICGQDIELIAGSLADNLLLGEQRISGKEIAAALTIAGLDGFVASLPDGLSTELGEQGHQLSGGQRQRLSLARAILRRPDVLVLDEATGMIDAEGQKQVLQHLSEVTRGMTVVLIGHQLPYVPPLANRLDLSKCN